MSFPNDHTEQWNLRRRTYSPELVEAVKRERQRAHEEALWEESRRWAIEHGFTPELVDGQGGDFEA